MRSSSYVNLRIDRSGNHRLDRLLRTAKATRPIAVHGHGGETYSANSELLPVNGEGLDKGALHVRNISSYIH